MSETTREQEAQLDALAREYSCIEVVGPRTVAGEAILRANCYEPECPDVEPTALCVASFSIWPGGVVTRR